jgi:chromosome segregation ATPase
VRFGLCCLLYHGNIFAGEPKPRLMSVCKMFTTNYYKLVPIEKSRKENLTLRKPSQPCNVSFQVMSFYIPLAKVKLRLGVRGRVVDLCKPTQRKFETAVSVILGRNIDAVVVDQEKTAIDCIQVSYTFMFSFLTITRH